MAKKIKQDKAVTRGRSAGFINTHLFELIAFGFAFLLFVNSIGNSYNLDDELVTRNHRLTSKGISAIPEILTSPYYQDNMGYSYEYRPVVLISFAIEYQFFGDNAFISHLINVLLYALCCLLLYKLLLRLFKNFSPLIVLAIVLVFTAYPAHTELVDSIKNRDDILGFMFSLLTLYYALLMAASNKKWYAIIIAICFLLALMSKLTLLPFALIIPLCLIFFTGTSLLTIMLVTLALGVPAFFMVPFQGVYAKLLFEAGLFGIIFLFYLIVRGKNFIDLFTTATQSNFNNEGDSASLPNGLFTGFNFKGNLLPPLSEFKWLPVLLTIVLTGGFCLGLLWYNVWLMLGCSLLLIGLQLLKLTPNSSLPNFGIYACLFAAFYKLAIVNGNIAEPSTKALHDILALLLCREIFFGRSKIILPLALLLTGIALADMFIIVGYGFADILPVLVFFALLKLKFGKWPLALYASLTVFFLAVSIKKSIGLGNWAYLDWANILHLTFLVYVLLKINQKYLKYGLILAAFTGIAIGLPKLVSDKNVKYISNEVNNLTDNVSTNVYNGKTDRPLSYVEESVLYSDPLTIKIGTSLEIMLHYLYKVALPYPLAFYYGYSYIKPMKITDPIPLLSLGLHLILAMLALLALIKKQKELCFALIIYFISMGALSNFFQPVPGMYADRFLVIPSLSWAIILVIGLVKLFKLDLNVSLAKWREIKPAPKYILLGVLVIYSTLTFARNFNWKDDLTLFRHDVKFVDESSQAHNLLALHIMAKTGEVQNLTQRLAMQQEALQHFKKAIAIYPKFFNVSYDIGRTYNEMSQTYQAMNNIPESYAMMDSAINRFEYTLALNDSFSDLQANLGRLLLLRNREDEAIPYLEQLLKLTPHVYAPYDQLSLVYFKRHEIEKSVAVNRLAIKNVPTIIDPYVNIARAYIGNNQMDSARYYLRIADEKMPNNEVIQQLIQQAGK